jgi:hypothetical protein
VLDVKTGSGAFMHDPKQRWRWQGSWWTSAIPSGGEPWR